MSWGQANIVSVPQLTKIQQICNHFYEINIDKIAY